VKFKQSFSVKEKQFVQDLLNNIKHTSLTLHYQFYLKRFGVMRVFNETQEKVISG
jgi:hypothetical protein